MLGSASLRVNYCLMLAIGCFVSDYWSLVDIAIQKPEESVCESTFIFMNLFIDKDFYGIFISSSIGCGTDWDFIYAEGCCYNTYINVKYHSWLQKSSQLLRFSILYAMYFIHELQGEMHLVKFYLQNGVGVVSLRKRSIDGLPKSTSFHGKEFFFRFTLVI